MGDMARARYFEMINRSRRAISTATAARLLEDLCLFAEHQRLEEGHSRDLPPRTGQTSDAEASELQANKELPEGACLPGSLEEAEAFLSLRFRAHSEFVDQVQFFAPRLCQRP
jgi:hypothetical protein